MSGDAEALSEELGDVFDPYTDGARDMAERILASDWLAVLAADIRAEALRDAADAADGFASGVCEDTGDWLRTRASDLARAARPIEGES